MADPVIAVKRLSKAYGDVMAVSDVSFEVMPGTVFGLVGPNGAGKSTLIECIEGLRAPTSGHVELLGQSQAAPRRSIFHRVGVLLQENEILPRLLRTQEVIDLYRSFYANPLSVEDILAICGLETHVRTMVRKLSGGQRRRLAVALALAGRPELVILDEPSSGLDPQARFNIWQALGRFKENGGTLLLSTHFMDEAEEYCDELCLLDHGRIQVQGNPAQLMAERNMQVMIKVPARAPVTEAALRALDGAAQWEKVGNVWRVYSRSDAVYEELKALAGQEILEMRPARLEDLYLMTTGRSYRAAA